MKVTSTACSFSLMVTVWEAGASRVYPLTAADCASSSMVHLVPTGSSGPEATDPSALTFTVPFTLLSQV